MSEVGTVVKARKNVVLAIVAATLVAAALLSLNQRGGPATNVSGVVQSLGYVPTDTGPPSRLASVALSDGTIVQASVLANIQARPGQSVTVKVYRRVLSGSPSYEIIGIETHKSEN